MLPLAGVRAVHLTSVRARAFCGSTLGAPASAVGAPGRDPVLPQTRCRACSRPRPRRPVKAAARRGWSEP
jgi:hypothetical protein